jgi:methoxymalonate biosynthesis acyl carrier protein
METDIKTAIKQFLKGTFKNYDLQNHEDIFALGFVNSLFAMQLVLFVEKTFRITIDNEDLELDNFRTINALATMVQRKKVAPAAMAFAPGD